MGTLGRSIMVALAIRGPAAHAAEQTALPRAMVWSAYNLGTTGYKQAVAIGKVLKDEYGVTLRVLPGKNDVSRLLPLVRGRVQLSANGVATYFAQEGVFSVRRPPVAPAAAEAGDDLQRSSASRGSTPAAAGSSSASRSACWATYVAAPPRSPSSPAGSWAP